MPKHYFRSLRPMVAVILTLGSAVLAAAELDFSCLTTSDSCNRTFSCPKFERLTHSKALCNIEGIALSDTQLASLAADTVVVARGPEPGSWGQCTVGSTVATVAGITYSLPLPLLSQRQLSHGCYDNDTAEWGPGECQVLGKATCQPYLGELRIASLQGMGPLISTYDKPVMQGMARFDRINPTTGESETFWLVTQANGASESSNAPDRHDYLRFQLRTNAGAVVTTFSTFRYNYGTPVAGNNTYIARLGHGQSVFVERNADGSFLVLVEADGVNLGSNSLPVSYRTNGNSLLQFRLSADLQSLSFVREVPLTGLSPDPNRAPGVTISPEVKSFSIHKGSSSYRMAVSAVRKNTQTGSMGRYVQVFDLPSGWISTMNSGGGINLGSGMTQSFWLAQDQYDTNQGIVLTASAVLSVSGNSALPLRSQGESAVTEMRNRLAANALGVNLHRYFTTRVPAPSATELARFKTLYRYPLSAGGQTVQRQYLFSDYQDLLLSDPNLVVDNYSYEPEGLYAVGDEVYFGLVYGLKTATEKSHRIYRLAESFFDTVQ